MTGAESCVKAAQGALGSRDTERCRSEATGVFAWWPLCKPAMPCGSTLPCVDFNA